MNQLKQNNQGETEFHQAVYEVYESVLPVIERHEEYRVNRVFDRMVEPERVISFRVTWVDDNGVPQVNRGYRVQMNSAIGPFKGGLRFHPSVNQSILKFLGFEQIFKNALTSLPLGGGKGGSNFDPKGKSDGEVMRFCQNFMLELSKHIGHRIDIPAGDIGVGGREIGYMYGMYRKIENQFSGVLTGKGVKWGGSLIRPEATGYGLIYFSQYMLQNINDSLEGKTCVVSGSGNVAQYAIEKITELGGKVVTASDSSGYIYDEEGISAEKLEFIKELKNERRGRIAEYVDEYPSATYFKSDRSLNHNPIWMHAADCAFPCATQNELNEKDADNLVKGNVKLVAEGANMPCTPEAINLLRGNGVMYAPGKASNAGGVATSGLEMVQNYSGSHWTSDEVDRRLQVIMKNIHDSCLHAAQTYKANNDYMSGANIAGFIKVADSMIAQGLL
ncbi:MAG: NADP-specific glutamate dehydrogenase [Roseivirga sp.]